MADRLAVLLAFPLPDSFCLGWFLCLAIFGFACYTNPSEQSFKSYLDQLPISSLQKSLQRFDDNLNLHNPTSALKAKNKIPQNAPKHNPSQRTCKNLNRTSSASHKLSFSPCASQYNRHNLLFCTLISIDHSHHAVSNISSNQAAEDGYPQLEWFFGCFDTWFSLQRQILPTIQSLSIVSSLEYLKSLWNRWSLNIPGASLLLPPPTPELFSSLQNLSPLSKGRRKKTQRSPKSASLRCQTSVHADHSTECPPSGDSFTSNSSGSEHDCYSPQEASTPSSPCLPRQVSAATGPSATLSSGNVDIDARSSGHVAPSDKMLISLALSTHLIPESSGPTNATACDTSRSESNASLSYPVDETSRPTMSHDACSKEELPQSMKTGSPNPSSECFHDRAEQDPKPISHDLEHQLKELDYKRNQEDLNKVHYQSSLKHLNEIKDLKEYKQRNLHEKPTQSKSAHAKLSKESAKVQGGIADIQTKHASIQSKFSRDTQQMKKEAERLKNAIKHSKNEIDHLAKANEVKMARKKELIEKLSTRQAELNQKRELNTQSKQDNKLDQSLLAERRPINQDRESQKSVPMRPHPSQSSTPSPNLPHEINNLATKPLDACTATANSSSTWSPAQDSFVPIQVGNSAIPMLFHSFTHSNHPLDDVWAPDPRSEIIQQNNIRESFISLPNLERSALKDHYPVLRAPDTLLSQASFPVSPLTDEFFNYPQDVVLTSSAGLTSDWARPVPSQPASPFGAIGQQGSPTRSPAHSSPMAKPLLFRFPDSSAAMSPSSCAGLMVNSGSGRQNNFSRTSSSSSLSQLPGYCSIRSSPASHYAPIGTPVHTDHKRLNELQESSHKSNEDSQFGRSRRESKAVESDFANSDALAINTSPRRTKSTCAAHVGLSGRETTEGIFQTGTIVEESPAALKKPQSTPSLGGTLPPEGPGLNSIFDLVPETAWPSPTRARRPLAPSPGLNPSAKAFTFSPATRPNSVARAYQTSSIGQQRARGYSQSTTSSCPATSPSPLWEQETTAESPQEAKLRKSLHRSSWSVVVGLKAKPASTPAGRRGSTLVRSSSRLSQEADPRRGSADKCISPEEIFNSHESMHNRNTSSPSGLASVLSPGHALPPEFTKTACAGRFGPIGDSKPAKKSPALSAPSSPPLPAGLADHISFQPRLAHRAGWN
ncbi:hypothetical protein PCANC_18028 [Puccinia coronata f. sp. avenae]|uniref:Uncharacterized protein n=1 Tax=Puccinia coronata f. sp. avenae TaxID=200324 RepID=A0A2N5SRZ3_9BASI|nr:hypothetical protein PCANC_18028 [Puccinia coronata f. sp. avenae]